MTATITNQAGATITPQLRLAPSFAWQRAGGTIVHPNGDVTLERATLRTGTLQLVVGTAADAAALDAMHTNADVFELVDTEHPETDLRYVVPAGGRVSVALDTNALKRWTVSIDVQEVA